MWELEYSCTQSIRQYKLKEIFWLCINIGKPQRLSKIFFYKTKLSSKNNFSMIDNTCTSKQSLKSKVKT